MRTFWGQSAAQWVAVLSIAVGMAAAAQLTHNRTVIFPEAAAIALGSLALRNPRWLQVSWHLVVMPTVCAGLGVLLNHFAIGMVLRETIMLWAVLIVLTGTRSAISPAISAGVLPVVLDIHTWLFVGSVFITTALVWIVVVRSVQPVPKSALERTWRVSAAFGVASTLWILAAGSFHFHDIVLPPLMVFLYEALAAKSKTLGSVVREVSVLTLAALGAVLAERVLHGSAVVAAAALVITVAGMRALDAWIPPAAAIALLPLVIPMSPIERYPLYVAVLALGVSGIGLVAQRLSKLGGRTDGQERRDAP